MSAVSNVLYFIFNSLFMLAIFILWIRIMMHWFKISRLNPLYTSINALIKPVITPIERLLGNKGQPKYDWAGLLLLIVIELIKFPVLFAIATGTMVPVFWLVLYVLADLIIQPCNLLFYAVIIRVAISWLSIDWRHPLAEIIVIITTPILRAARVIIPEIGGFDLSPILVILVLKSIVLFIGYSMPIYLF